MRVSQSIREMNTAESFLCCVSAVLVKHESHVHACLLKYESCDFGDCTRELNAPVFAFKIGTAGWR